MSVYQRLATFVNAGRLIESFLKHKEERVAAEEVSDEISKGHMSKDDFAIMLQERRDSQEERETRAAARRGVVLYETSPNLYDNVRDERDQQRRVYRPVRMEEVWEDDMAEMLYHLEKMETLFRQRKEWDRHLSEWDMDEVINSPVAKQ